MAKTIIDGIDVSKCKFFFKGINEHNICCYCDTREDKIPFAAFCEENPDCYFKQLSRAEVELQSKEQECEELYNQKMKLIDKSIEQKCKIRELIDENATKEVIYKVNGKCAKTVANKVEEIRKIVEGKDCKYSKYKQALDEIEEFMIYEFSGQNQWVKKNVLDIINKAKEQ